MRVDRGFRLSFIVVKWLHSLRGSDLNYPINPIRKRHRLEMRRVETSATGDAKNVHMRLTLGARCNNVSLFDNNFTFVSSWLGEFDKDLQL